MQLRIKLDFIIDTGDRELPELGNLLDGFQGAAEGLYPSLKDSSGFDILPGGKASFTRVVRMRGPLPSRTGTPAGRRR